MGRCKAQLPHPSGRDFLGHAIDEIAKVSTAVAVAINPSQETLAKSIPNEVAVLYDQSSGRGPAEGILQSLHHALTIDCAGVLVTPVDLPYLHRHELEALVVAFEDSPAQITCAVSFDACEQIEPLVAIYPIGLVDPLEQLVASNDRSLYRFIQRNSHQTVRLSSRSLSNINTPEDLNS